MDEREDVMGTMNEAMSLRAGPVILLSQWDETGANRLPEDQN